MKLIYDVSDRPKFGQVLIFALQQLLAILAATIAVPAIIGNGMRTYDEILSVIMGGKSDYQITEDASSSINKLFDKYATQSQEEKGEESLDEEGEPYAYGDFRDEDPSEGYTPECEGEECEFGENTLQRD